MIKSALFIVASVLAMPALAQVSSIESSNSMPKGNNPNAKICERVVKTGSRLGAVSVCMTASEWAELKRGQRDDLERVQRTINMPLSN